MIDGRQVLQCVEIHDNVIDILIQFFLRFESRDGEVVNWDSGLDILRRWTLLLFHAFMVVYFPHQIMENLLGWVQLFYELIWNVRLVLMAVYYLRDLLLLNALQFMSQALTFFVNFVVLSFDTDIFFLTRYSVR